MSITTLGAKPNGLVNAVGLFGWANWVVVAATPAVATLAVRRADSADKGPKASEAAISINDYCDATRAINFLSKDMAVGFSE